MAIQCQYKQESDSNDKTCTTAVIDWCVSDEHRWHWQWHEQIWHLFLQIWSIFWVNAISTLENGNCSAFWTVFIHSSILMRFYEYLLQLRIKDLTNIEEYKQKKIARINTQFLVGEFGWRSQFGIECRQRGYMRIAGVFAYLMMEMTLNTQQCGIIVWKRAKFIRNI